MKFLHNLEADDQNEFQFLEGAAGGSHYLALKAAATMAADVTLTLPNADSSGTQALVSNGSGTLSWSSFATSSHTHAGADITSGSIPGGVTWNGVVIGTAYGGTGAVTYDLGEILVGTAGASLTRLGIGTVGQVLTVAGGTASWATPASDAVSSVFGRTGAVVAASGDYTATQITTGTFPSGVTWNGVIVGSAYGGTGNGFTKFTGPATSEKTFTLPNASATILTTNAVVTTAQGGTGNTTYTNGQLLIGQTSGSLLSVANLTAGVGVGITNGAGSITIAVNQSTGWTTPACTPERTTLLCGASATADNCSKWIRAIITDLKAAGIFAA